MVVDILSTFYLQKEEEEEVDITRAAEIRKYWALFIPKPFMCTQHFDLYNDGQHMQIWLKNFVTQTHDACSSKI